MGGISNGSPGLQHVWYARCGGSQFLCGRAQGVQIRSQGYHLRSKPLRVGILGIGIFFKLGKLGSEVRVLC